MFLCSRHEGSSPSKVLSLLPVASTWWKPGNTGKRRVNRCNDLSVLLLDFSSGVPGEKRTLIRNEEAHLILSWDLVVDSPIRLRTQVTFWRVFKSRKKEGDWIPHDITTCGQPVSPGDGREGEGIRIISNRNQRRKVSYNLVPNGWFRMIPDSVWSFMKRKPLWLRA